jgi:hypothetical protein
MNTVHTIWRQPQMTYAQALRILNARRRGQDMDEQEVLKALEMTGDYDPDHPDGFRPLYEVQQ